ICLIPRGGRRDRDRSLSLGGLFGFFLFHLFGSDVDLVWLLRCGFLEVADPFSEPLANLGEFSSTEDDENDDQNDEQFWHSDSEHSNLLRSHLSKRHSGLTRRQKPLAEVHGNRTHHGHFCPS